MEWKQLADYKIEKQIEDELHTIKIMHIDLKKFCVCVITSGELPKSKRKFQNLLEVSYNNMSEAVNLYYGLNRGFIYMDNII